MRDLTVHDITHIDALWETASIIAGDSVGLTPTEAFVLGEAFLLHDLGMGLAAYPGGLTGLRLRPEWNDLVVSLLRTRLSRDPTPDEVAEPPSDIVDQVKFSVLRLLHAEQAERLAALRWEGPGSGTQFHLIEDSDLRTAYGPLIGKIAHSHWWPTEDLPQKFPPSKTGTPANFPNEWVVDAIKLALLLRLADAAHLDGRRAPAFLRAIRRPKGLSDLHWVFQGKLYQVQREADKLVYTSQPFARHESQAWWLCHDTLCMVDAELRRADELNTELHRERFAARGVRSVEDPCRLAKFVTTDAWLPANAQVRVGRVADLVRKLGGRELYGDDTSVPLRELLQNATDAVRARRMLQGQHRHWGEVRLRVGTDEHGLWLEVEDNGVGMSARVLTGPFLDFGSSLWSTPDAVTEFPGLLTTGFRSTGRYGIGFFSVFMWSDRVRVTTRRYDEAVAETRVLEFEAGLEGRPLVRNADRSEWMQDGGTKIRVWPRDTKDINGDWIRFPAGTSLHGPTGVYDVARAMCIATDVTVLVENDTKSSVLVRALDWLDMPGEDLLDRVTGRFHHAEISRKLAGRNVRPLFQNGQVVGRATICPGMDGAVSVGGFRSQTEVTIAGVLLGESTRASRDEAIPVVSETELARWSNEQAKLIRPIDLSPSVKAKCARLIAALGGKYTGFPLARVGATWLTFDDLVEWSRELESVIIIDEADEDKAVGRFGATLRGNVLVEPGAPDSLIAHRLFWLDRPKFPEARTLGHRPVLRGIQRAWNCKEIEVWRGEFEVDEEDAVSIDAEEVRRADNPIQP